MSSDATVLALPDELMTSAQAAEMLKLSSLAPAAMALLLALVSMPVHRANEGAARCQMRAGRVRGGRMGDLRCCKAKRPQVGTHGRCDGGRW